MSFVQKYLWLIISISIIIGLTWSNFGIVFEPYVIYILMTMMTISGLNIDFGKLSEIKYDWPKYLVSLAIIFMLPAFIVILFKNTLSEELFIGLMLAAVVPCGISVVPLTSIFNGTPVKALITTTIAHIMSLLVTPLIFWIFTHKIIQIDIWNVFFLIFQLVIIPLVLVQLLKTLHLEKKIPSSITSIVNIVLLMILIIGIISSANESIIRNINTVFYLSFIVISIVCIQIFLGIKIGNNKEEKITLGLVYFYKNFTLASVIALEVFGPESIIGPIVFLLINNIALVPYNKIAKNIR